MNHRFLCCCVTHSEAEASKTMVEVLLPPLPQRGSNSGRSGGCHMALTRKLQQNCCLDERGLIAKVRPAGLEPRSLRWLSRLWGPLGYSGIVDSTEAMRAVEQWSFGLHKKGAANRRCIWYRSHFGSRYTLGCCSFAGLFGRAFELACSI